MPFQLTLFSILLPPKWQAKVAGAISRLKEEKPEVEKRLSTLERLVMSFSTFSFFSKIYISNSIRVFEFSRSEN
jgi:hypothetical protein